MKVQDIFIMMSKHKIFRKYIKKCYFFVVRTFETYSQQISTIEFIVINCSIMLHTRAPELLYLITENLYYLINICFSSWLLASANYHLFSDISSLFFNTHVKDIMLYSCSVWLILIINTSSVFISVVAKAGIPYILKLIIFWCVCITKLIMFYCGHILI